MIIVKISGRLGNQLFQYALARKVGITRNIPVKLDLSWYRKNPYYVENNFQYELDNFKATLPIAADEEIHRLLDLSVPYKIYRRIHMGVSGRYLRGWIK